jgi:Tol biopolymer transport system component
MNGHSFCCFLTLAFLLCSVPAKAQIAAGKLTFADSSGRIWVINEDGSGQTMLTTGNGNTVTDHNPVFSPDGSKIAFDRTTLPGVTNIYVMNADGTNPIAVTSAVSFPHNVSNSDPTWSPDGTSLAFVSNRDGSQKQELWIIRADGTGLTKITTNVQIGSDGGGPLYAWDVQPSWAPDGSVIAFSSTRDNPLDADIYLVNPDGTNLTRLRHPGNNGQPSWSPDSQRIGFDVEPDTGINIMNRDGSNIVNVTNLGSSPAWSPDGTRFAILSSQPGDSVGNIFTIALDGSNLTRVTSNSFNSFQQSWAPTGSPIPTAVISGRVSDRGGVPVTGALLTLTGAFTRTAQTDGNGSYAFTGLSFGNYRIEIAKPGYGFNPASVDFTNVTTNQTANFTAYVAFSISGTISGLTGNGVVVNLTGTQTRTAVTDVNGHYFFDILPIGGKYIVTPTSPYFTISPSSTTFNNLSANQVANFSATRASYTISGTVTKAGLPFSGVTVSLNNSGSPTSLTTLSDANGHYSFTNMGAGGSYYVTAQKGNYVFQPPGHLFEMLDGDKTANFVGSSANHLLFSNAGYSASEGSCTFQVTVVRGGNAAGVGPITVDYATTDGTATAGLDYTAVSGTLHFPDGSYSRTITIPILVDQLAEGNEAFNITLSNPTGEVELASPSTATITIMNINPQPAVQPLLITESSGDLAVALNNINLVAGPFLLTTPQNFSTDLRTRLSLFVQNVSACDQLTEYEVQAQDAQQNIFALPVESVIKLPGNNPFAQLIVRLPEDLPSGELTVTAKVRGLISNSARLVIGP